MISRIINENLFQGIEKKAVKRGIIFFLITVFLFAVLLSQNDSQGSNWYKSGFYILLYLGICGLCFFVFFIQSFIKGAARQKSLKNELKLLEKELDKVKKLEALGIIARSVAHDLNNILSGMATYPEVLMMDKKLDPKVRQGLDIIKDSGQEASALVRDLLTISRGSSVQMEPLNINSVIERYAHAHDFEKIRRRYKQVTLEMIQEPELSSIKGSYIHIEITVKNLLLNAMEEVCGNENGHVIIQTANRYVDPSIPEYKNAASDIASNIARGEYVVLSVIDNGCGFDKKHIKKIFEPFFTKKQMGKSGTGLGLTVVWNTVQDHGGFVNLMSDKKGTRFDLFFPATRLEEKI